MMLSEVLSRFFVLPLYQSGLGLVDSSTEDHPEHGEIIAITWTDSVTFGRIRQEFVDQEVDLGGADRFRGQFNVTPIDGDPVAFIALDAAPLESIA